MSSVEKKKAAELLFGEAQDGTNLIYKSFGIKLDYFLTQELSDMILLRNVEEKLKFE